MLLLLICLFFNYDLFNCEQARKRSVRSNESQLSAQVGHKPKHESDALIRELREKMFRAQAESSAQDFGLGVEDYNISPMEVFTPPTGENNNFLGRAKGRSLAEEHKEEFMNYDLTKMFWSGTPKLGDTLEYTTPISFLPTPEGFGVTSESFLDPWQILVNFSETTAIPGPSTPSNSEYQDMFEDGSASTVHKFETPNLITIPHYMLGITTFPRPSFPFPVPPVSTPTPLLILTSPNSRYTGEEREPTMYTGPLLEWSAKVTKPTTTTTVRTVPTTTTTTTTESTTTSTTFSTLSPRPPIPIQRQQAIAAGRGVMSGPKDKALMRTEEMDKTESLKHELVVTTTPITEAQKPPEKGRTLSKAESMLQDKEWTKLIGGPSTEPTIVSNKYIPTTLPPPTTLSTDADEPTLPYSTRIVSYVGLLTPDDDGFYLVSTPAFIPEVKDIDEDTETPPTAGDVLLHPYTLTTSTTASPESKYLQKMEEQDEGVMGFFLVEFTRLLCEKNITHVGEVVTYVEILMNQYEHTGALQFLGEKLAEKARALSMAFSEVGHNPGIFRNLTILAHMMIKQRRTVMEEDVNYLIDEADLFYNDEEGSYLLETLIEFENYPNVSTSARDLCANLLDAFSRPFRRLSKTDRAAHLRKLAEAAVEIRFGRRMQYQELMKLKKPETTILNSSSIYNEIYSLKQRMEMKRRRKNLTRRVVGTAGVLLAQQTRQPSEQPRLRSMLPITRNQKRFRVITKRQRTVTNSANIDRPTRNDQFRKSGRVIHPYNNMMQFFPQIPKEYLRHAF